MSLLAAKKASKIALYKLKNFKIAVQFYRFIVLHSLDKKEMIEAQEHISMIYYEKLVNYSKAIEAFSHLIRLSKNRDKNFYYRMSLSKSYYFLKNFFQAEVELNLLLRNESLTHEQKFKVKLFKAQVFLAKQEMAKALKNFQRLEKEYPLLSKNEKVGMSIVICYEEMQKYDKAIKKLASMRPLYPHTNFIDLQLEKLRKRQSNMPGFRKTKKKGKRK